MRSTQRSRETALNDDSASTEHRDREIASSHPVSMAGQSNPGTQSQVQSAVPIPDATADLGSYNTSFILPTHTHELGSLPIYESEDWNEQWLLFNSQTQHIRGSSNPNPDIRMMPTLTPDEFGSNSNLTSMDIDMTFLPQNPLLPYSSGLILNSAGHGVASGPGGTNLNFWFSLCFLLKIFH